MMPRVAGLVCLALAARLPAQAIRFRSVAGARGTVSVGMVGDTVWLSMRAANGDVFTIRSDSETMAAWADSATLYNDQAITFTRVSPDSESPYIVHAVQGTRRDSVDLFPDDARTVFAAMRGAMPIVSATGHVCLKFQVQQNATVVKGSRLPEYPEREHSDRIPGIVVARFVVDSTGRVDARSITILSSTMPDFGTAVLRGMKETRFKPALADGRPVAEIMEMRFRFLVPSVLAVDVDLP